jgi:hypothetical protein
MTHDIITPLQRAYTERELNLDRGSAPSLGAVTTLMFLKYGLSFNTLTYHP